MGQIQPTTARTGRPAAPETRAAAVNRMPTEPQREIGVRTQSALPPKAQDVPTRRTPTCRATAISSGRGASGAGGGVTAGAAASERKGGVEGRERAGRLVPGELPLHPVPADLSPAPERVGALRGGGAQRLAVGAPGHAPARAVLVQARPRRRVRHQGGHARGEGLRDRQAEVLAVGGQEEERGDAEGRRVVRAVEGLHAPRLSGPARTLLDTARGS